MTVKLLHNTPLWVASKAIRKCWASEDKSDTTEELIYLCPTCNIKGVHLDDSTWLCNNEECKDFSNYYKEDNERTGPKDRELIHRVGNKNKHASTLEHINYTFDIDGISRACLQELARHRHASMSVKSTRYTLKELKEAKYTTQAVMNFLVKVDEVTDEYNFYALCKIREELKLGKSNDKVKYSLPEAYKTSLVWTINMRSLQNFLALRTNKAALWEIRDLANLIYNTLPEEHKYMYTEFIYKEIVDV